MGLELPDKPLRSGYRTEPRINRAARGILSLSCIAQSNGNRLFLRFSSSHFGLDVLADYIF
jgi:hypothetical protein